jgi:predicted amino acid-binding ACT domain protein
MAMTLRKSLILGVLAEESGKTKKARAKLKCKLEATEKKLQTQNLDKKSQEISKWIERHANDRVSVKKDISLFDQNRNSAKMSRNIEKLAEELALDLKISREAIAAKKKK